MDHDRNVIIIGDGPIGLLHLQLSKLYGAKTIIIGKNAERIRKAKSIGADQVIFAHDLKQTKDNILGTFAHPLILTIDKSIILTLWQP